jgi:alpha-galactosidase
MYLLPTILLLAGIANSTPVELSKRIKNGVGLTPAMGFNNWNSNLRKSTSVYLGFASSLNSISILSRHSSSSSKSVREPWT